VRGESEEKKNRAFQYFAIESIEGFSRGQQQVCLTNSACLVNLQGPK
jgi:hypothetical protein